jgi:hypothetical protein
MSRLLFTVSDRFLIRGRGLVVVPGIPATCTDRILVGDPILLKRPDGSALAWTIGGIEMFIENRKPYEPNRDMPILLTGLGKEDVPVGTEIWTRTVDPH